MTDHQPNPVTPQGFVRANFLTLDQLDGIIEMIRDGVRESVACRAFGTSHTQFIRRCKKEPGYSDKLDAARLDKRLRQDDSLHSDHGWQTGFDNAAGFH